MEYLFKYHLVKFYLAVFTNFVGYQNYFHGRMLLYHRGNIPEKNVQRFSKSEENL